VKDPVYSGRDVREAVGAACAALGVVESSLRYVILDPGRPAALGVGPEPARIAVLLDGLRTPAAPPATPPEEETEIDPVEGSRRILQAVARAADVELSVEIRSEEDAMRIRLSGPDRGFFLDDDGAVLEALEHLLQRMFAPFLESRRLLLDYEGHREARDEALRRKALGLAEAVRADGTPRVTDPLNAYERRIVHMALAEEPGITTYSVGEGAGRRVTIAPETAGTK
jgi:spoIIIJ-associated protein